MLANSPVEFVGPFEHHEVVVHGWQVPFLNATPLPGGRIHLNLDHRLGVDLTVEEAERFVPFLADCIAVAMGYTCHPRPDGGTKQRLPFTQMVPLAWTEESSEG